MRRTLPQAANDEQAVFAIISWNDVVLPNFHKTAWQQLQPDWKGLLLTSRF
jgi:hypothetical protein